MAGMLVTRFNPLLNDLWAVLFGGATAWFGWRISRTYRIRRSAAGTSAPSGSHNVPHLVMCGAMVYMFLAAGAVVKSGSATGGVAMGGPGGARFPLLALVLALFMFGYVMWQADRLPALARAGAGTGTPGSAVVLSGVAPAWAVSQRVAGAHAVLGAQATRVAEATADPAPGTGLPASGPLSPRLAACCQIAMGITMGYMLILMV